MARQRFGKNTAIKILGGTIYTNPPNGTLTHLSNRATTLRTGMNQLKPVLNDFGEYMVKKRIPAVFRKQGLPRRWKPLAPSTLEEKERLGYGSKGILERTGRLKRSWRYKATQRTVKVFSRRSSGGVNIANVHQYGSRDRRIPARRMLVIGKNERDWLSRRLDRHFE